MTHFGHLLPHQQRMELEEQVLITTPSHPVHHRARVEFIKQVSVSGGSSSRGTNNVDTSVGQVQHPALCCLLQRTRFFCGLNLTLPAKEEVKCKSTHVIISPRKVDQKSPIVADWHCGHAAGTEEKAVRRRETDSLGREDTELSHVLCRLELCLLGGSSSACGSFGLAGCHTGPEHFVSSYKQDGALYSTTALSRLALASER
ncbi:hypothetical protein EYF80_001371 [Liparis tanakae]|uniref:Uncharacterized protein n=1 Tax=Liparis tanakae TaxID=230148 RepID=A0A4Z2JG34_9TELE|nr:hypothetical protein EYF80_001371 [Liparis tanakae]